METIECIKTRQSIRKFKQDPVARETIMDLLETARWSPSYKNSQPWEIVILSGKSKEAVTKLMNRLLEAKTAPSPDIPAPTSWPKAEQGRIDQLMAKRLAATGINLNDPEVIKQSKLANFNFYGAPHGIYLFQDNSLSPWSLLDLGLFAQSLMLTAHDMGLATVPQAFATDYAKQVKELLHIAPTKRLVLGLSIGYPDLESPVNSIKTDRDDLQEITSWLD